MLRTPFTWCARKHASQSPSQGTVKYFIGETLVLGVMRDMWTLSESSTDVKYTSYTFILWRVWDAIKLSRYCGGSEPTKNVVELCNLRDNFVFCESQRKAFYQQSGESSLHEHSTLWLKFWCTHLLRWSLGWSMSLNVPFPQVEFCMKE